jgi:hypothetical protein
MRAGLLTLALLAPLPALAQHDHHMPAEAPQDAHQGHDMPAQDDAEMDHPSISPDRRLYATTPGTGTSLLPGAEGGMRGLHLTQGGDWMVMAHGNAMVAYTDQGGPRGDDGVYTGSMAMLMAQRDWASGVRLRLSGMWSLDPINGKRGYPNLLATGETANGMPLVDRQHPHDFFMELSARIDVPLGGGLTGFVYGGPVAEPALGPSAFVHRRSARYLPQSPIGHHWFDSSHVTFGVVTAGLATKGLQLEASAFKGREPDEERWGFDKIQLDSWSVRATFTPTPNWALQVSHGRLEQPEAMHAGQDERRTTASAHYATADFSAMLGFAAKDRLPGQTLTAWLAEANWNIDRHHSLFGRIENNANDELFPDHDDPRHDTKFRVSRFEGGYAYRIPLAHRTELAFGGSVAAFAIPRALDSAYGRSPVSYTGFVRFAVGQ